MGNKYLFACDQPHCFRRLTFNSPEEVEHERVTHKCPNWGGESKVGWSVTKTLVEQMWEKLDAEVDAIKGNAVDPQYHQHRARAFAECLAIFMTPFFETADDIVRESMKRWQARQSGDSEYETAGLGIRRYESAAAAYASAASGWYGTASGSYTADPAMAGESTQRRSSGRVGTATVTRPIRLTQDQQDTIRTQYASMPDAMTIKLLAQTNGVSEEIIRRVVGIDN